MTPLPETEITMNHLTNAQLVEHYNAAAQAQGRKTVKRFRDRETALRRIRELTPPGATWARVVATFADRARTIGEVAEETGLTPRQVRTALDNARKRGHTVTRVAPSTFEVHQ